MRPAFFSERTQGRERMSRRDLLHNITVTACILAVAVISSAFFFLTTDNGNNASLIYVLAIVLISRYTYGYHPGIIASIIGVVAVNFFFTYPYGELNFTMTGYPITFMGMLAIALITSATTTHMKAQAEALSEREKLLMEAEKEKMRANLLRAVSHDLRTPLTAIIGSSSSYLDNREQLSQSEKDQLVSHIYDDANWLLHMVENLLAVTRIHPESAASINKSMEPVEEVVAEAVSRFKARYPESPVHVCTPEEFYMIPMDPTLIEQVIMNLLENAAIHAHSQEAIDLTVTAKDGQWIRFQIKDYGQGISPERLETIFEGSPYGAGESADSKRGMGIGLTICKTIITVHGGTITAHNHAHGAVFAFLLPIPTQPCA